jgi:Rrf2 family transcriptional regulator, iron-sulfur cluster assembly transcription factor
MRITQWGEYGIHCAAFIASKEKEGATAVPAADIAADQKIALDYTQQILQRLRKNNIVKSIRGPQGGYKLSRAAKDITLHDILIASEGDTFEVICETKPVHKDCCAPGGHCNLRPIWHALKQHVNSFLTKYTLDAVVNNETGLIDEGFQPVQISGTNGAAQADE